MRIFLEFSICILLFSGTSFSRPEKQSNALDENLDSCFISYIKAINPRVNCKFFHIEREYFPMLYIPNQKQAPYVYWTAFGDDLIIGVSQNLFDSDDLGLMTSYNFFSYSKSKKDFLLFFHDNEEDISCRKSVSIIDIIPRSHGCFVFDNNFKIKGDLIFQFLLPTSKASYTFIREHDKKKFSHKKKIKDLDEYNGSVYKLIHYELLREFIELILNIPALHRIPDSEWEIYKGNNQIEKKIEMSKRTGKSCQ